jgi:TM2 domain-containing membrane protein YozV
MENLIKCGVALIIMVICVLIGVVIAVKTAPIWGFLTAVFGMTQAKNLAEMTIAQF